MDSLDLTQVEYYSVGEMNLECHFCQAPGFVDENRGTNRTPHFGILCCKKNKCVLGSWIGTEQGIRRLQYEELGKAKGLNDILTDCSSTQARKAITRGAGIHLWTVALDTVSAFLEEPIEAEVKLGVMGQDQQTEPWTDPEPLPEGEDWEWEVPEEMRIQAWFFFCEFCPKNSLEPRRRELLPP